MRNNLRIIYKKLKKVIVEGYIEKGISMSEQTSFRIGGKADIFVCPATIEEIVKTLQIVRHVPHRVVGAGSNLLVSDKGFRGVIINLTRYFKGINLVSNMVEVSAGTLLSELCVFCKEYSFTGLESLFGIPGSVGGCTYMNAGANGSEIADHIHQVLVVKNGKLLYLSKKKCGFSYRHSEIKDCVVVKVFFVFEKGDKEEILRLMKATINRRALTQPLNYPSAGSVFKRKDDIIISKIIDVDGLKGYNINDAEISKVHAGFIVNKGKATCSDVLTLIDYIKTHFRKKGIEIEEEIEFLGEK